MVSEGLARNSRKLIVVGLMLATFLSAMDSSVVSTAMPTITGILGGFSLYSWVFSIYLLTSTVTVPIYGKLADLYGRKRVLLFGILVFLLGSGLCGLAQSMLQLVIFRGIQGIGAGAILPITMTIFGDIFSIEERARVQGLTGSVWGISAIVGPALGGLIVDNTSWRWVFLINLPAGLLSLLVLIFFFHEKTQVHQHSVDYVGAIALMAGSAALLLALTSGGRDWEWVSAQSISVFLFAVLSIIAFLLVEVRVSEPILPLSIFADRMIAVSGIASLLAGGVMIGATTYVPLFAQGSLGTSATVAGAVLATMSIGWPIASSLSGRLILRVGYRITAVIGGVFLVLGSGLLFYFSHLSSPLLIAVASFVIGAGMGFSTTAFIVGIQNAVDWSRRGVATSSNLFLRSMGASIWVALLGAIANNVLISDLNSPRAPQMINQLLQSGSSGAVVQGMESVRLAISHASQSVFFWQLVTACITFIAICFMPSGDINDKG